MSSLLQLDEDLKVVIFDSLEFQDRQASCRVCILPAAQHMAGPVDPRAACACDMPVWQMQDA